MKINTPLSLKAVFLLFIAINVITFFTLYTAIKNSLSLISLTAIFTVFLAAFSFGIFWVFKNIQNISPKQFNIKKWITIPSLMLIALLILMVVSYSHFFHLQGIEKGVVRQVEMAKKEWEQLLFYETKILKAHSDMIMAKKEFIKAFKNKDREELAQISIPFFENLRHNFNMTHAYFIEKDRTCFFRGYTPDRFGDVIKHKPLIEAQQLGVESFGIEIGSAGTLTLRFVSPWRVNDEIIGYLQLGMELEHLSKIFAKVLNFDIITTIRKSQSSKEKFEKGRAVYHLSGDWDKYPDVVVVNQTLSEIPREIASIFSVKCEDKKELYQIKTKNKQILYVSSFCIKDVYEKDVADIFIVIDMTNAQNELYKMFFYKMLISFFIGATFILLIWIVSKQLEQKFLDNFNKTKDAEDELKQKNEYLDGILKSQQDLITRFNIEGKTTYVNDACCKVFGKTKEELIGQDVTWLIYEDDIPKLYDGIKRVCEPPYRATAQIRVITDKGLSYFDWEGSPIRNNNGDIVEIQAIGRDISEQKKAEEELKKKNELLKGILESQQDLIVRVDRDNNFTYVNDAYCKTFGVKREDLIGKSFAPLIHEEDVAQTLEEMKKLYAYPFRCYIEQRAMTVIGWRHLAWEDYAIKDENDNVVEIQGVGRDITAKKEAEKALKQQSLLRNLLIEISAKYINLPLSEVEFAINNSLAKMANFVGADRAYIFDYDFSKKICQNTYEWCSDGIEAKINELQAVPLGTIPEWVVMHRLGKPVYIADVLALPYGDLRQILESQAIKSLLTLPLMNGEECIGFVGFDSVKKHHQYSEDEQNLLMVFSQMLVNIRLRQQADAQIYQINEQLEKASKAKSEFLANMSHEIRTPMNAVLGLIQLLKNTKLDGKQKDYADKIEISGQSLLYIINDILDFSKIETGKFELSRIKFNLDDVLRNLATILAMNSRGKDLEVLFNIQTDLPNNLIGDPQRLEQVLINLSSNAIKFTRKGEVVVSIKEYDKNNAFVVLSFVVRDTGVGISSENILKIFEPFEQEDTSTSRKFGGTGLGLSISQRLVRLMGGEIIVKSEVGKGSEFIFNAQFGIFENSQYVSKNIAFQRNNLKILIVDDNHTACEILENISRAFGWQPTICYSGETAIEEYQSSLKYKPFDVIFMDIKMPNMDGVETTKIIRKLAQDQQPKIIMISAVGLKNEADEQLFNGSLLKPSTASMILDSVVNAYNQEDEHFKVRFAQEPQKLAGLKILLVEDNVINLEIAKELLEDLGAEIVTAENGLVALQKINPHFDAVLMDMQMPKMDGYEATLEIRKSPEYKKMPIIAMTANVLSKDRQKCFDIGMNDHIPKPVDVKVMVDTILKWTKGNNQETEEIKPIDKDALWYQKLPKVEGFDLSLMLEWTNYNQERLLKMLQIFIKERRNTNKKIDKLYNDKKYQELLELVHSIKGSGGMLGAIKLADKMFIVQKALKDSNFVNLETKIAEAKEELERTLKTFKKFVNAL